MMDMSYSALSNSEIMNTSVSNPGNPLNSSTRSKKLYGIPRKASQIDSSVDYTNMPENFLDQFKEEEVSTGPVLAGLNQTQPLPQSQLQDTSYNQMGQSENFSQQPQILSNNTMIEQKNVNDSRYESHTSGVSTKNLIQQPPFIASNQPQQPVEFSQKNNDIWPTASRNRASPQSNYSINDSREYSVERGHNSSLPVGGPQAVLLNQTLPARGSDVLISPNMLTDIPMSYGKKRLRNNIALREGSVGSQRGPSPLQQRFGSQASPRPMQQPAPAPQAALNLSSASLGSSGSVNKLNRRPQPAQQEFGLGQHRTAKMERRSKRFSNKMAMMNCKLSVIFSSS